jgi:hypothetical protein
MSMILRIIPGSPALSASAANALAPERANPRAADRSGTPSWAAMSVIVDGLMIEANWVNNASAINASLSNLKWLD